MKKIAIYAMFVFTISACNSSQNGRGIDGNNATFDFPVEFSKDNQNKVTTVNLYKPNTTRVLIEPQFSQHYGKVVALWVTVVSERTIGTPLDDSENDFLFNNVALTIANIEESRNKFIDSFGHTYTLQEGEPLNDWYVGQVKMAHELPGTLKPSLNGKMNWSKETNLLIFTENGTNRKWQRNSN